MLLLTTPRILFVDDAFIFLNTIARNEILRCLKRLNKEERTIIIISAGRVVDVEKIINRIIIMDNSRIIYDDTYKNFSLKYANKKIFEVYLNKNISIKCIDGVEVIDNSDYYFKLKFENKENMFANVINLFDVNNIIDLSVSSIPLGEIITMIKKDE